MKKLILFISLVLMSWASGMAQNPVSNGGNISESEPVMEKPEKLAQFPGGMDAYVRFLSSNLQYPEKARHEGVQGKVVLQFIVDKNGYIRNIKVLKSLSPECDKEAIRMVKAMPRWFAAENGGQKVNCLYTCPITFRL